MIRNPVRVKEDCVAKEIKVEINYFDKTGQTHLKLLFPYNAVTTSAHQNGDKLN